ncbi:MAG: preprotein translocase subunit SecE [Dehalococcoidales bacterium]|nr:preprotein translocase subunit SecE [Dehalococcoidales bacterium]
MTPPSAAAKREVSRFRFIGETMAELKKVVWLTRRETAYLTVLVLIVIVISGLVLGVIDLGFAYLVNRVFWGG